MKCPCCGQEVKETKQDIDFNRDTHKFTNITDIDINEWKEAYPAIDVVVELKKMVQWLLANPTKLKKNYRKFITNWLSVAQQRGGDRKSVTPQVPSRPQISVSELPVSKISEEKRQENIQKIKELIKKSTISKEIT